MKERELKYFGLIKYDFENYGPRASTSRPTHYSPIVTAPNAGSHTKPVVSIERKKKAKTI
jgi:hypothetical protein